MSAAGYTMPRTGAATSVNVAATTVQFDVGSPPDAIIWDDDTGPGRILSPPELGDDASVLSYYSFEFEPECATEQKSSRLSVGEGRAAIVATVEAARALATAFTYGDDRAAAEIAAVARNAINAAPIPALVGGERRAAAVGAARRALAAFASASASLSTWGAPSADLVAAMRAFVADLRAGVISALRLAPGNPPADQADTPPDFAGRLRSRAETVAVCLSSASGEIDRAVAECSLYDLHTLLITLESLVN